MDSPRLIGPRRRAFQWVAASAVFLLPFLTSGGDSLFRIDLASRSLLAFGARFYLDELYLFLLLVIATLLLVLAVTLVFGRVWCGWACPQTVLSDLVEGVLRLAGARVQAGTVETTPGRRALLHLVSLVVGFAVSANLLWYFISPYEFFPALAAGRLPSAATWVLLVLGFAVYLDLTLVRRTFCRTVCPYGRIQTAVVDPATLTLVLPSAEAERCIECRACVRACPTGIDIRNGDQVECINCGRCLDACRRVMARRSEPGLISYRFGREGRGPRALWNPRTAVVGLAAVTVASLLVGSAVRRPQFAFSVRRSAAADRVLSGGRTVAFFTAVIGNLGRDEATVDLAVLDRDGAGLAVHGQNRGVRLEPGERREVALVVEWPALRAPDPTPRGQQLHFHVLDAGGRLMAERTIRAIRRNGDKD